MSAVWFGGPDLPYRQLRDLLEARIEAVPADGAVDWVTYYLRDIGLVRALLRAKERGVALRISLEARPHLRHANDAAAQLLQALGPDLALSSQPRVLARGPQWKRPFLHGKLYAFSHPLPHALLGSFNPSGNQPETDPGALREIGDHDRGFNDLVEIDEPVLVAGLQAHARQLHQGLQSRHQPGLPRSEGDLEVGGTSIHFWPRQGPYPIVQRLALLAPGDRLRLAASHIKPCAAVDRLCDLARRGIMVAIICDVARRRVPEKAAKQLREAGANLIRLGDGRQVPMHHKFALLEAGGERLVSFGSWNWTARSSYLNHEISAMSNDPCLYDQFDQRWHDLAAMAADGV